MRARQRAKARQVKAAMGSARFRPKAVATPTPAPSKPARAIRVLKLREDSSGSEAEDSDAEADGDLRQMYSAVTPNHPGDPRSHPTPDANRYTGPPAIPCSHCGSAKHDDLGCWKRLTCQKCGRRGHPSDRCLFLRRACGEVHEASKCPMEEFYNMIRQWYVPTKNAGMLPEKAQKMLN